MDNQGRDPINLGELPWLLRSVFRIIVAMFWLGLLAIPILAMIGLFVLFRAPN
jgi:hypothetical protein